MLLHKKVKNKTQIFNRLRCSVKNTSFSLHLLNFPIQLLRPLQSRSPSLSDPKTQSADPRNSKFSRENKEIYFVGNGLGAEMRRRTADFRRPVKRRVSNVFWLTLCGIAVLLFIVLLSKESKLESRPAISKRHYRRDKMLEGLNITDEMLSPNSVTRQLSDQIALAKAFVVIAKESNNHQFAWELSAQIRNSQILLSNAATRRTPLSYRESETVIHDMALLLYQAQQLHFDSATMIMRLKAKIQTLEEQMGSVTEKSSKYGQIAAEEVPKSLYCLGVRLATEWFGNSKLQKKHEVSKKQVELKLKDNNRFHFCVFSDNILATSVVVNSTALNSKKPDTIVFHLVTDEINYASMKAWFSMNNFRGVTVEVQKFEDFSWLNASYVPVLKQLQDSDTKSYYFSGSNDGGTPIKFRNPKYLSMLNHLRFYIPEVFPSLKKVVFLDDDVVVQKDLSGLFSLNLNNNVIGAVETCMETFHRYHKYLNYSHPLIRSHFDPDACGWAFGMNVFDLVEWRKRNVTGIYHYWQEKNVDRTLWKLGTLPPGLLTFYGLTEPLDPFWHVLGLGYTSIDPHLIEKGAVLHYNGNSKPWLKIGMEKYKPLWEKYVDYSHPLLQRCNFR